VLRDTVAGGVVGSAVAGGIILYNMGIQDEEDYDWGRTLAWGAIIGIGAGLAWGIVDATTGPAYAMKTPLAPVRDGQSMSLNLRRSDRAESCSSRSWSAGSDGLVGRLARRGISNPRLAPYRGALGSTWTRGASGSVRADPLRFVARHHRDVSLP
jgi:hypothetical protein